MMGNNNISDATFYNKNIFFLVRMMINNIEVVYVTGQMN